MLASSSSEEEIDDIGGSGHQPPNMATPPPPPPSAAALRGSRIASANAASRGGPGQVMRKSHPQQQQHSPQTPQPQQANGGSGRYTRTSQHVFSHASSRSSVRSSDAYDNSPRNR